MNIPLKPMLMQHWRTALLIVVVVAGGAYLFDGHGDNHGATLTVMRGDFIQKVHVSGTVVAAKDADLGFATNGRIQGTYAKVGDYVYAGSVLAEVENGDLLAALTQKKSALVQQQAELASLNAGTRSEEIVIAETSVKSAKAALVESVRSAYTYCDDAIHNKMDTLFNNARTTDPKLTFQVSNSVLQLSVEQQRATIESVLSTWASLVANLTSTNVQDVATQSQTYLTQVTKLLSDMNAAINQSTSSTDLTSSATTLATARNNVDSAATTLSGDIADLESAEANLVLKKAGATVEDIAAQEAVVAAAEADVQNARSALLKTRIIAPFTGTVTRMDAKVGEIVSPSTSLVAMQSNGTFEIETYVPEVAIAHVMSGNAATTTLDAYGSKVEFPATVVSVDPAETVKDGVPTYKVLLAFLSEDARIRSGMTTNVVIETGVLPDTIVIPAGAVGKNGGDPYVSVVTGETVENRTVLLGETPALGQVEIVSGLSSGDVILLTPAASTSSS